MPVSMELDLNGIDKRLLKMATELGNLETPLKQSGVYMEGVIGRRFRGENNWAPLSEATIEMHPHRAGGKPLEDTGALRKSVTSGASKRIDGNRLEYGTSLKKAPLHNFGGMTKRGYVPQREFLHFDSQDEEAIKTIFEDYIRGVASDV